MTSPALRLGHIVIRTAPKSGHHIFPSVPCRQDQNRHGDLSVPKFFEYGKAIKAWKVEIEDNCIPRLRQTKRKSFLPISGAFSNITPFGQNVHQILL